MNLDDIKKKSEIKEKKLELKKEIYRLRNEIKDINFNAKKVVESIENKCISKFEDYFKSNGFKVSKHKSFAEARYSATEIVIEKSEEIKPRDHLRIKSHGVVDIDKLVKIDVSNLSLKDYEVDRFEFGEDKDIQEYKKEISRLKKSKRKKINDKRNIDKSNFKFIYIEQDEVNDKNITTKEITRGRYVIEYGDNVETKEFDKFESLLEYIFNSAP